MNSKEGKSKILSRVRSWVADLSRNMGIGLSIAPGFVFFVLGSFQLVPHWLGIGLAGLFGLGCFCSTLWDLQKAAPLHQVRILDLVQITWQTRMLGMMAVFFIIDRTGGFFSPLHGLIYLSGVASFPGTAKRPFSGLIVFLFLGEFFLLWGANQLSQIPISFLLMGTFASLPWFLTKSQQKLLQKEQKANLANALSEIYQEASLYRLRPSASHLKEATITLDKNELVRIQGSLLVVKQTQNLVLQFLHQTLKLHSAVLLWLDDSQQILVMKSNITNPQSQMGSQYPADSGTFGTILKHKSPVKLSYPKSSHLPYYSKGQFPEQMGAFLGIPILLPGGEALGILCLDRLFDMVTQDPKPFSDEEQVLGQQAAIHLVSSLQSEKLFIMAERSRDAQARLYQASSQLNRALTQEQVYETTFFALEQICHFDFAAITRYDGNLKQHQIVAIRGEKLLSTVENKLLGFSFPENTSLVSMVIKNQLTLPEPNVSYADEVPLFDPQIRLRNLPSVLVLPLFRGDSPTGTLVLGSQKSQQFGKLQRELLGIIANQVAVAIENALCYQSMEAMASIDGLTQLFNRRTWQERFSEMLERAQRHQQCVTLLLLDIDYFKKINDTFGHLMGDQVLKQVAQVIQSCVRKVDVAARYGGEEFAVVLDRAEGVQAFQLAERIRQEIGLLKFAHDQGSFQCTLSIGLSTFPMDGQTLTELAAHADQALYHAKHQGRNRTSAYTSLRALPSPTPPFSENQTSLPRIAPEPVL